MWVKEAVTTAQKNVYSLQSPPNERRWRNPKEEVWYGEVNGSQRVSLTRPMAELDSLQYPVTTRSY